MVSLPWLFWEFSLLFSFGTAWSRRRYGRAFRSISLILVVISVLRMAPWFPGFFFQRLVFVLVKDRHPPQISQGRQLHTATKVPRLPADRTVWCGAQTMLRLVGRVGWGGGTRLMHRRRPSQKQRQGNVRTNQRATWNFSIARSRLGPPDLACHRVLGHRQ